MVITQAHNKAHERFRMPALRGGFFVCKWGVSALNF